MSKISYNVLDFKETKVNIITDITIDLFMYISKKEQIAHLFYINLKQGASTVQQISIPNKNLNECLAITKSILTPVQLRALMKSKSGNLFNEKHQSSIRRKILASNGLKHQTTYAANHYDYDHNRLMEYAIQLMV